MSENPANAATPDPGVSPATTTPAPTTPATAAPDQNAGTGSSADAAGGTDHAPSSADSVSDQVDHEGTGAGETPPPASDYDEQADGTDNA